MTAPLNSSQMRAQAGQLHALAVHFTNRAPFPAGNATAARTFLAAVGEAWIGPRADNDLAAISRYVEILSIAATAVTDVAGRIESCAVDADDIATRLGTHERIVARVRRETPAGELMAWEGHLTTPSIR